MCAGRAEEPNETEPETETETEPETEPDETKLALLVAAREANPNPFRAAL